MGHPLSDTMLELFRGLTIAHGIYNITKKTEGVKQIGQKIATVREQVTRELWDKHLSGEQGLGIVPINEDNKARFAVIDIDDYGVNHGQLAMKIYSEQLPVIPIKSKSGGLHLYCFLDQFVDASLIQAKIRQLASYLGYGSSEIFPKQTKLLLERGDMGQWINVPYFGDDKTDRYALGEKGEKLNLEKFIKFQSERQVSWNELKEQTFVGESPLPDGPPCLNYLATSGFPGGTRNNGLFNLGIYAMKSNPDTWERSLEEFNTKFMDPPLTSTEVLGVMKSLRKKTYQYTCAQAPIVSHCDKIACRRCKFGVGGDAGGMGMPKFGTLTKVLTIPPVWFLEVEGGGRLELSTDDLQKPVKFQNKCMEHLNVMPQMVKHEIWQGIVTELLKDMTVIDIPQEATPRGQLIQWLEEFCTSRVAARTEEEMLLGKPWTNDGRHRFRLRDFLQFLERNRFRALELNKVAMTIREMPGFTKGFTNIKGKGINWCSVPEFNQLQKALNIPKSEEPPL